MKQLLQYIKEYQRKHFDWKMYGVILLFTAVCIYFNYRFDFEDSIIDRDHGKPIKWLWMFLFHSLPFVVVSFILYAFGKKRDWLADKNYWFKVFIGFSLLALGRSFYGFKDLLSFFSPLEFHFAMRCANWASKFFLVVVPLLLLYPFLEKEGERNFYGLSFRKFDAKPYLILLLLAGFFIWIGSFMGDIQEYYPRYLKSGPKLYLNENPEMAEGWLVAIFELCYGSSFISVEVMFRGFLIFAFARTLGGYAILPMVVSYAFLHFGKPIGETISSIFGGYLLGIIAYKSRNVWGGIFIHMGVAWLMELFGWLQR